MKALLALLLEALEEAWYPQVPDGQARKVKVNAGGLALVIVLLGVALGWNELRVIRAEVADVKVTSNWIRDHLLARGVVASAAPTTAPVPTRTPAPVASWPPGWGSFLPSAHAEEVPIP